MHFGGCTDGGKSEIDNHVMIRCRVGRDRAPVISDNTLARSVSIRHAKVSLFAAVHLEDVLLYFYPCFLVRSLGSCREARVECVTFTKLRIRGTGL